MELMLSNGGDFETLAYIYGESRYEVPKIKGNPIGKPVSDKEKAHKLPYFFSGELSETTTVNGKTYYIRNKANTRYKSLITIDIEPSGDDVLPFRETLDALLETFKPYNYLIYPTTNNRPDNSRFRVILEPEHVMSEAETKATTDYITSKLKEKQIMIDDSSHDYSRVQGLPVDNGLLDSYKVYINTDGRKVKVRGLSKETKRSSNGSSFISYRGIDTPSNKLLRTFIELLAEGATDGNRNVFLTRAMGYVIGCHPNPLLIDATADFINQNCIHPPLPVNEVRSVTRSILKSQGRKEGILN